MDRVTLMPVLVALIAGAMAMPALNIFKVCARNAGTMRFDPWRLRSHALVARVSQTLRAWLASLLTPQLALLCLAVLLALLASHLGASHGHQAVVTAVTPLVTLQSTRAERLREAAALQGADGTFKDDAARAAFDAKMTEIESLDAQIRAAAPAVPAVPVVPAAAPAPAVTEETRQALLAAVEAERGRVLGIQGAVRFAKLEPTVATEMIGRNLTLDQARSEIFQKLAAASEALPTRSQVEVGADAQDKFLRGATNWLLVKAGMAEMVARHDKVEARTIDPGEFRGLSLVDLARLTLERVQRPVRGMDKMRMVSDAFTARGAITQTTSDFATLLENVMHKVLQAAYAIQPDTWRRFCATSTVSDFRAANRYRMGSFGALDALNEAGEFKNKAITDAEKATITAATKGNIINVSRQMIINDDMNAFGRLLAMLGRAAALSTEVDVYALIAQNGGLGPNLSDGHPLFDAAHANVGVGAVLSAAGLDADRVAMGSQKDKDGNDYIDLRPAILLVPLSLGGQARVINLSQYDPDTVANKAQMKPNVVAGLFRDIVDTPRITGTRRYLFADPGIAPVLEVAFLEGQTEPVLESQDGWRTDGAELKVRFDYGVAAVDFRGAETNAGA